MHRRLFLPVICSAFLSCAPADSDRNAPTAKATDNAPPAETHKEEVDRNSALKDWKSDFEEMVSTLKLTDEESAKLKAAFEEKEKGLNDWFQQKGSELEELEQKLRAAVNERDLPSVSSITQKAKPLRDELIKKIEQFKTSVRDALPEARRIEWEAHVLAQRLLELMESLKLSDEQVSQIRAKAKAVLQSVTGEKNPDAAGYLKLEREVEKDVLSPEQRDAFEPVKKKHPLRSLKH